MLETKHRCMLRVMVPMSGRRGKTTVRLVGANMTNAVLHALDAVRLHHTRLAIVVRRSFIARIGGTSAVGKLVITVKIAGAATQQVVTAMVAVAKTDGAVETDIVGAEFAACVAAGQFGSSTLDTPDDMLFFDRGATIGVHRFTDFRCWFILTRRPLENFTKLAQIFGFRTHAVERLHTGCCKGSALNRS